MNRQRLKSHTIGQILGLFITVSLMILMGHLPTEEAQHNNSQKMCIAHSDEAQFIPMPKQEVSVQAVKRIRRMRINIEINFLEAEGILKQQFMKWQEALAQRKSYLNKSLLIAYIHDVDGKKHNL